RILGEDRQAREHRLVPEYIERFFKHACRYLDVRLEQRPNGLWRVPSVPYELRNVSQEFKHRFGEVFREYSKIAFDKHVARSHEAVFVAPGHPLLETVIEAVLERCQSDVQHGAVFADPDGRLDGWLWFLQGELRDGNNEVAGRRLFAIFQPANGGPLQLVNSSILWDLKPLANPGTRGYCPPKEEVISFAVDHALEPYRAEILRERQRQAQIREKYGLRSLEQMILDSQARLIEYETRRTKGEPVPEVEITNEQRRKEDHEARKRALEEDIRRQTSLLASTPEVLGVARVVPQPVEDQAMRSDAEIEAIGMQVALEYERQQGRTPEDVSAQSLGYDIRSQAPDGTVRYIEVKARATTGAVVLTPNEWLMAQRLGDDYWLYVIENAATAPELHTIQNPTAKLEPQVVAEVVRYVVADWKKALEEGQ
ncbi:MAG: DUF3883 domain-containing protein, partial [Fimbriimonadales bacterium]|nr:DUF3883 domain-containing protein [Fimbriimonadales bacterium]